MSAYETLIKAAEVIESHGWVQFMERTPEGAVCANGALALAAGVPTWEVMHDRDGSVLYEYSVSVDESGTRRATGCEKFFEALDAVYEHNTELFTDFMSIVDYNDAPGRKKEEVIRLLRETASAVQTPGDKLKL